MIAGPLAKEVMLQEEEEQAAILLKNTKYQKWGRKPELLVDAFGIKKKYMNTIFKKQINRVQLQNARLISIQSTCAASSGVTLLPHRPSALPDNTHHRHDGWSFCQGGGEGPTLQLQGDEQRQQVHHSDVRKHHQ